MRSGIEFKGLQIICFTLCKVISQPARELNLYQSRKKFMLSKITDYYIHTKKYTPKSYVVNFRTQMSSSQSEERTMVFTREKK